MLLAEEFLLPVSRLTCLSCLNKSYGMLCVLKTVWLVYVTVPLHHRLTNSYTCLHASQCIMHNVSCTMYPAQYICTMYPAQCIMHNVSCTMCMTHCNTIMIFYALFLEVTGMDTVSWIMCTPKQCQCGAC